MGQRIISMHKALADTACTGQGFRPAGAGALLGACHMFVIQFVMEKRCVYSKILS